MTPPRIPSLNWLRVFEAAMRHGSFARAAGELGMSPPAVTQQIRSLEGHLGQVLFQREARRVVPTQAAIALLYATQDALRSIDTATRMVFGDDRQAATLSVQVMLVFGLWWLVPRLPSFRVNFPHMRLQLATGNRPEEFMEARSEIAVVFGSAPVPYRTLEPLFGEELFPVARAEIAATVSGPSDLLAHTLIEISGHRSGWAQILAELPPGWHVGARFTYVDHTPLAFALAAAGEGIAIARAPVCDAALDRHGLVRIGQNSTAGRDSYALAHHGEDRLSPAARAFRDWLLKEAGVPQ